MPVMNTKPQKETLFPADEAIGKRLILMADDDPDEHLLVLEAIEMSRLPAELETVKDGEELLDRLYCRSTFSEESSTQWPALIMLDINMPRKNGWEALAEIKKDYRLRDIPVVIYSTSSEQKDIDRSYEMGATSYITKPYSFESLVRIIGSLERYMTSNGKPSRGQ